MIDQIEGTKKPMDGPADRYGDEQAGAHAKPQVGLNLHLSAGDALVYLFVPPEQFLAAQHLVNRWHKSCEGQNTCFLYVKTHIQWWCRLRRSRSSEGAGARARLCRPWTSGTGTRRCPATRNPPCALPCCNCESPWSGALSSRIWWWRLWACRQRCPLQPRERGTTCSCPRCSTAERASITSAPLLFSSAVPATDTDPRAFAGTGWAVLDMLRELQSSSSSAEGYLHYQHSGNAGVMRAVRCYQRLHPRLVAADPHRVFNKPEGNRRWHWMTDTSHPLGLIQASKERALYLYAPSNPAREQ